MSGSDAVPTATVVLPVVAERTEASTLRDILDTLGPYAVRLVTGSADRLDAAVGEPVVHGLGEPIEGAGGAIVLLAGARPGRDDTIEAIRAAGASGCRAVVIKAFGDDLGPAARAAEQAGVVLLCTADEMAWRHLDALVTAARAAAVTVGGSLHDPGHGDLFALANAIASSLGGAITIEEPNGRVMAYSNLPHHEIDEIRRLAILGRQTPDRPTNPDEYRAVLRAPGPVFFESSRPDYASRMAVAIRAGHQILGVLWVLCDRPPLVADAQSMMVDAARAAALHLLRRRGDHDPERARRTEALRELLAGSLDTGAAGAALGLPVDASVVVVAVRPESVETAPETAAARIADLVALHGEYWHAQSTCVVSSGVVLLMLPVEIDPSVSSRLRKLGSGIVSAVSRSAQLDVYVGAGPVVRRLADVGSSRWLAEEVVAALARRRSSGTTGDRVATLDDVRSEVVLAGMASGASIGDDALMLPQVRAVIEHDAAQGTSYAQTLLTYVGSFGDVVDTAKRLNIHENTARYRVRRLGEMFGIDLAGGDDLLVTWMQLRLYDERRR